MKQPRVTVLVLSYERPLYLMRAVSSVLEQTWSNKHILLVDDASGPETQDLLDDLERRWPKGISIIRHKRRRGPASGLWSARHKVVAAGEHLAFLADDDEWEPTKLERQMDALGDVREALVCSEAVIIDERHELTGQRFSDQFGKGSGDVARRMYLEGNFICASSALLSPGAVTRSFSRLPRLLQALADAYLWTSVTTQYPLIYLDEPLTRYRVWKKSLTWTEPSRLEWEYCYSRRLLWKRFPELRATCSHQEKRDLIRRLTDQYSFDAARRGDFLLSLAVGMEGILEERNVARARRLLGQVARGWSEHRQMSRLTQ